MRTQFLPGYLLAAIWLFAALPVSALQGGTTRYVYDNNGRLRAVTSPTGEAAIYDYDPAGNFTAIRRLTANDFEVIEFTPRQGPIGTSVTIFGVGFGGTVSNVSFNGTTAQIISQTPTSVTANVPAGATTGPISVTSPRGTGMTAAPFTVSGVGVAPNAVVVSSGRTRQFTAVISGLVDPTVTWSVNSIPGGNASVGTITANGLYTAPDVPAGPAGQFTVRATSASDPTLFGEAQVTVPSQGGGYELPAHAVSVRYGAPQNIAPSYKPAPAVSVRYGTPPNSPPTYLAGGLVSVRYGTPPNNIPAPLYAVVSATAGPVLSSLSPATIARGATATLTVNGANLAGASSIRFINVSNGTLEPNITATNIVVNGDGTSLTATVTVNAATTTGKRIVSIVATAGNTLSNETGVNTIDIVP